jgi:hypothetical protein
MKRCPKGMTSTASWPRSCAPVPPPVLETLRAAKPLKICSGGCSCRWCGGWRGCCRANIAALRAATGWILADLREYQFHDDVRRIDWNATARLDTPFVRGLSEDREIPVWFLLDMSPSMLFEGVSVSKHSVLMEFTTLMCRLMLRPGQSRRGDDLFRPCRPLIPGHGGRRQLLQILNRWRGTADPNTVMPPT